MRRKGRRRIGERKKEGKKLRIREGNGGRGGR